MTAELSAPVLDSLGRFREETKAVDTVEIVEIFDISDGGVSAH